MSDMESAVRHADANDLTPLLDIDAESSLQGDNIQNEARRVSDFLPHSVWIIASIEFCERFAFFGISGPMQNFIHSLGLEGVRATMTNQLFLLWCYITPILGAVVAEQYLGRLNTIVYSSTIYCLGLVILTLCSLPSIQETHLSLLGLFISLLLIGVGTGGIKPNVGCLAAEQYILPSEVHRLLNSGERVIVDRDLTIQRIFSMLFMLINIGSFGALATTALEQTYGFPYAFALPATTFFLAFIIILANRKRIRCRPPQESIIFNACRAIFVAMKNKGNFNYARPDYRSEDGSVRKFPWDDLFIENLQVSLSACGVFVLFPFYWAAYSQLLTNFIAQAATMETYEIPNDVMANIVPVTTFLFLPLFDRVIFPLLRKFGITTHHLNRMVAGFLLCGVSMIYAAYIQATIYAAPPCFDHPRALDCFDGRVPNHVSIFMQLPAYTLIAVSEILTSVAGIEYAYTKAPKSMESLIIALYLSTVSTGALIALVVSPLTVDPGLTWMYSILGVGPLSAAVVLSRKIYFTPR